jgi:hypothetical protein
MTLWYSDKKPGDLCTRQQMIELLLILMELYPSSAPTTVSSPPTSGPSCQLRSASASTPSAGLHRPITAASPTVPSAAAQTFLLPQPHLTLFSLVRSLLLTEAPAPAEQPHIPVKPHSFIESLHVPRIYKTYLQELSDICRDYFWIFCHPQNTIWRLSETDIGLVEAPKAPGGMTGGVEYEAVTYMVCDAVKFLLCPT